MKCEHENKNGTCGLRGNYAYRHKCYTEDFCKCFQPQTNADRIRSMNDEALAEVLMCPNEIGPTNMPCGHSSGKNCCQCILDWLRQPANKEEKSCHT